MNCINKLKIKMDKLLMLNNLVLLLLLLVMLLGITHVDSALPSDIVSTLKKMKINPDLVSNLPDDVAQVTLQAENGSQKRIKAGEFVQPKDLKEPPLSITWGQTNADAQSTIIVLDVDRHRTTPNNSINSYNLWTIINVPGESIRRGLQIISWDIPKISCTPGSAHRLVLLVYHQNKFIDLREVIDLMVPPGKDARREDFRLNEFVNSQGLTLQAITAFHAQGQGMCSSSVRIATGQFGSLAQWISALVSLTFMLILHRSSSTHR